MLITSSVIELIDKDFTAVGKYLADFSGVEVRGISKDMSRMLLIIETEDSEILEKISEEIRKHHAIISLVHHSFYFDEGE